jgi:uncharacterized protein DUF1566
MPRGLNYAVGLLVLGTLTLPARVAEAQTTAVGPYYAVPAWDQTLACTALASCPRFVVLSNFDSQAVLDRETGLVWQKSPDGLQRTWRNAHRYCNTSFVARRMGWRLPTLQELQSLLDATTLPAGHPFGSVQLSDYWSATTDVGVDSLAWFVNFGDGFASSGNKVNLEMFAWCVRGESGVGAR